MKNVYFACSIRGGGDMSQYQRIADAVKSAGSTLLSEVFVNDALQYGGSPLPEAEIYARDIAWIKQADAIIAEVTNPSLGVGYELAYAEQLGKPILCLFAASSDKKLSAMVRGNPYVSIIDYDKTTDLTRSIQEFFEAV